MTASTFNRAREPSNPIYICPDDAQQCGVEDSIDKNKRCVPAIVQRHTRLAMAHAPAIFETHRYRNLRKLVNTDYSGLTTPQKQCTGHALEKVSGKHITVRESHRSSKAKAKASKACTTKERGWDSNKILIMRQVVIQMRMYKGFCFGFDLEQTTVRRR